METVAFISGCLGIALSTFGLGGFAIREHRKEKRRTVSELAAKDKKTLLEFRIILWTCGTLIAVCMFYLVLPSLHANNLLRLSYAVVFWCELLLAAIPAYENKLGKLHNVLAFAMAGGMLALAFCFIFTLSGNYALMEVGIFGSMVILGILALRYWDHFLYFQLPFIFMSHMSILIAAIAVR